MGTAPTGFAWAGLGGDELTGTALVCAGTVACVGTARPAIGIDDCWGMAAVPLTFSATATLCGTAEGESSSSSDRLLLMDSFVDCSNAVNFDRAESLLSDEN